MTTTFRPQNEDEVREVVLWAAAEHVPLEISGNGTKHSIGRPVAAEHAVSLAAIDGIVSYEPRELVMTVRPGTGLGEVRAAVAKERQQLAFEPPDYAFLDAPGDQTIGGAIACNLSGPRRIAAGAARDHILGVKAVSGRGETFVSGGRVVKNVTGYDLSKLIAGSWGTLGVMTEVTLKVLPAAETSRSVVFSDVDPVSGLSLLRAASGGPWEVTGLAFGPETGAILRLEGTDTGMAERARSLIDAFGDRGEARMLEGAASEEAWRDVRDVVALGHSDGRSLWRLAVPPASAPGLIGVLGERYEFEYVCDRAGGLVWLSLDYGVREVEETVRDEAIRAGGHATLYRSAETDMRGLEPFHPVAGPLDALQHRIKLAFDPHGILNPGRMYEAY